VLSSNNTSQQGEQVNKWLIYWAEFPEMLVIVGRDANSRCVNWTAWGIYIMFGITAGAKLVQVCKSEEEIWFGLVY
jgi:hypothetical protein